VLPWDIEVAFLGDGQADDARRLVRDAFVHRARAVGRNQQLRQAVDHLQPLARGVVFVGIADRERVKTTLRRERVVRIGAAQRDPDDAPAQIAARGDRRIGRLRHVRPLERADAEVHDAVGKPRAFVRLGHQTWLQALHRSHQFQSVPSCCSRFTGR